MPTPSITPRAPSSATPHTAYPHLIGWRLLGLLYDAMPVLALWFVVAVPFVLLDVALNGGNIRHNVQPFSALQWLQWCACWLVTGTYAVVSWRKGGQTLGMRPWRLRVVAMDGGIASRRALALRYAVATLSVAAGGLGLWWSLWDRDRLTWHDRASGTRLLREARP